MIAIQKNGRMIICLMRRNYKMNEDSKKIDNLCKKLAWFNSFVDYIQASDCKAYNNGCEYADKIEKEEL